MAAISFFDYDKIYNNLKANSSCMEVLQSHFFDGNAFNLLMVNKKFSDCCDESCEFHPYQIWNCKHFRKCILDFTEKFEMNWPASLSFNIIQTIVPHDRERLQLTVLARMQLPLHYNPVGECYHGHLKSKQLFHLTRLMCYDCSNMDYIRDSNIPKQVVDADIDELVGVDFKTCSSCESCTREVSDPVERYPAGCPNNIYHYDGSKVVKGGLPKTFFMKPVGEDGDREVFCVVQLQVVCVTVLYRPHKSLILTEANRILFFEEDFKPVDFGKAGYYEPACCKMIGL